MMQIVFSIVLALAGSCQGLNSFPEGLRMISNITVPNAAYCHLVPFEDDRSPSLFVTSFGFNPFNNPDKVAYWADARFATLGSETPRPQRIVGDVTWPNYVVQAPRSVFGMDGIVVAGGFLVPTKTNGGIWFSARSQSGEQGKLIKLFGARNYFYHQVQFYDVDKDGQLDILTCRATVSPLGKGHGHLTYLVPKDRQNPTGEWIERILSAHCDTLFSIVDLDNDGVPEIVAVEYWSSRISVIKTVDALGRFSERGSLRNIVVERYALSFFDESDAGHVLGLSVFDMNNDGQPEIIVTNHQEEKESIKGSVYAYEYTSRLITAMPWKRHVLSTGQYHVLQKGTKAAAPGLPVAFYPNLNHKYTKPLVALAGDASRSAYILVPKSEDPNNWEYESIPFHDCKATVGGIAVGDVDGDGQAEIFVPCYETGYVAVYTFGGE